jgi:hypothetical protein
MERFEELLNQMYSYLRRIQINVQDFNIYYKRLIEQ